MALMTTKQQESNARSDARFAEAFGEQNTHTCPYGSEFFGCDFSFHVNVLNPDKEGGVCPHTHQQRLVVAHRYGAKHYADYAIEAAENFVPDKDLFDKTEFIVGDESYERMLGYHIQGLMHEKIVQIEDKIFMKDMLKKLGIPATTMYFGAHKSTWTRESFAAAMKGLCDRGVGKYIIKATHLAWSKGQKIVVNWDKQCASSQAEFDAEIVKIAEFIEEECLNSYPNAEDMHLTFLEPGVTVEELFNSGGNSGRPLELKVVTLWGKAYHAFAVGSDTRGCRLENGAWTMYPDGSGWNMNGVIGIGDDAEYNRLKPLLNQVFAYAEAFAVGTKADYTRADFFIGWDEEGAPMIKMNEGELVSGAQNMYDRTNLAGMWRDGYVATARVALTADKYRVLNTYLAESWERFIFNPAPSELERKVTAQRLEKKEVSDSSFGEQGSHVVRAVGVEDD